MRRRIEQKGESLGLDEADEDLTANPCEPPHLHYMQAARGWLELGMAPSALQELNRFDAQLEGHPDVLLLRWEIHAAIGNWDEAYQAAQNLIQSVPEELKGWLNCSEALKHMDGGGVQSAYEALLSGAKNFRENYLFHLSLARYACLAGKIEVARHWLKCAGQLGSVKKLALDEPDLEPIWEDVKKLDC